MYAHPKDPDEEEEGGEPEEDGDGGEDELGDAGGWSAKLIISLGQAC